VFPVSRLPNILYESLASDAEVKVLLFPVGVLAANFFFYIRARKMQILPDGSLIQPSAKLF
jgi:hypothetical protein